MGRRAAGEGRGQIVGFLTEGRALARQVEQGLPINTEALKAAVGNAQMASQMAMGIGVLNLGVQVAGFAMVMKRLDRISSQTEEVKRDLKRVGENVEWLTMAMMAGLPTPSMIQRRVVPRRAATSAARSRAVLDTDAALDHGCRILNSYNKKNGYHVERIEIEKYINWGDEHAKRAPGPMDPGVA